MENIVSDILKMGDHRNDHHLVKDIKKREGNAQIQILTIRPDYHTRTKMSGILDITSVQITPLNRDYIKENVVLTNILGRNQVVKRGSDEIMIIDFSAVAGNKKLKKIACHIAKSEMYMITAKGTKDILVKNRDGGFTSLLKNKRNDCREYGPAVVFSHATSNGLTQGTKIFGGKKGGSINSASQGRKSQITYHNVTSDEDAEKFYSRLDTAIIGEWSKRKGYITDPKGVVDANTRISSKTTAMSLNKFQGCEIRNYVILFKKINESDGCSLTSTECVARIFLHVMGMEETRENIMYYASLFEGYLLQIRPYTVKASSNVEDTKFINRKLENYRIKDILVSELTDELIKQIDTRILAKGKTGNSPDIDDFDGVRIIHNSISDDVEFVGDLNAFKDIYDYRKLDGINILAVAHEPDDWKNARTSAQLMKIVIRSVNDSETPGIKEKYVRVMEDMVRRSFDSDADFTMDVKRQFRFEDIEIDYISGLARQLNPNSMKEHPELYRLAVSDLSRTLLNRIRIDRYDQFGHSGMICVDRAFELLKKDILFVTHDYFEVYDPSANRYFKEMGIEPVDGIYRGVGQKYPSMGTLETSKLVFVTDEEIAERINALEISESDKVILAISYARLREGAVCIPSDLDSIAKILAGSDEDGDKFVIFFQNPENMPGIVELIWESGMTPRAVSIVSGEASDNSEMEIEPTSFVKIFEKNTMKDNKKVGPITNAFRIITDGLIRGNDPAQKVKDYYVDMFIDIFNAGSLGNDIYSPQAKKIKSKHGYWEFETCGDFYKMVMEAVSHMAPTWENVRLAMEDFDILGRHTQELTIDAQKKFYDVTCNFIEDLRSSYSIIPLKFGFTFMTDWNVDESLFDISDDLIMSEEIIEQSKNRGDDSSEVIRIIPDAFAPIRRYAINYALEILNNHKREYVRAKNDAEMADKRIEEYANALKSIDANTQTRLDHVIGFARTVNKMYCEKNSAMNSMYLSGEALEDMTSEDVVKAEMAIRYHMHEEYDELMSDIDNEIRKISNNIDSDILVSYLAASTIVGNKPGAGLSRVLKEETAKYLANRSEIRNAREEVRIGNGGMQEDLDLVREAYKVKVEDHTIFVEGTPVPYLSFSERVGDGTYTTEEVDGKVYLTRPISEFIKVPEADDSTLVFSISIFGGNYGIKNFEEFPIGHHIKLVEKTVKGKITTFRRIYAVDTDGNEIAEVFCGAKDKKGRLLYNRISGLYKNLEGDFAGIHVSENGVNSIVKLVNVRKSAGSTVSIEDHSNDVTDAMAIFNADEADMSFFA